MDPVLYERIDSNNVRIGTKWFKFHRALGHVSKSFLISTPIIHGVTIFEDGAKRFIANSWYEDINTDNL